MCTKDGVAGTSVAQARLRLSSTWLRSTLTAASHDLSRVFQNKFSFRNLSGQFVVLDGISQF